MRTFWKRLTSTFRKPPVESELDSELRLHLELRIEEGKRQGMQPEEARRNALLWFGGMEQVKEKYRDRRGMPALESLLQDIRFGCRMMRRSPGFTVVAAMTLALGVGATTAVFSVVNAVIMRPLRFPQSDRLMALLHTAPTFKNPFPPQEYMFFDWRARSTSFETIAGALSFRRVFSREGESRFVATADVSFGFFDITGARPVLGRLFTSDEDQPGSARLALLDEGFWKREFGGSPDVLGRVIILDDTPYTVIGILPQGTRFANFGPTEIWAPLAARPSFNGGGRGDVVTIGRLRPGVSRQAAQSEMEALTRQLASEGRAYNRAGVWIAPLRDWIVGDIRRSFLMLLGAVAFVLLICCANIANLLLARSTARQREMAIRAAMGAGRFRLVRQTLIESLLLASIGGAVGLSLAFAAVRAIPAIRAIQIPRVDEVRLDGSILVAALVVTLTSGILFGLAPALQMGRGALYVTLHSGDARGASGVRLRNALAAGQLALALILLSGAGLMTNSLVRLMNVDLGFQRANVINVNASLPYKRYNQAQRAQFERSLAAKVRQMPGVQEASAASYAPLEAVFDFYRLYQDVNGERRKCSALARDVDSKYLRVLGIPLLAGRDFEAADDTRKPVPVLLNRSAAQALFAGEDPIGKIVMNGDRRIASVEVVGIVGDVRLLGLTTAPGPQVYLPLVYGYAQQVVARTAANAGDLTPAIRAAIRSLDGGLPPPKISTMDARFLEETAKPRFYLALLGAFAVAGLILAAIGIYGVMSYTVARRTHEFGIRMALGARQSDVLRLVLGAGMRVTCAGALLGLAGALTATRLLSSLLYEVKPGDPLTFACVVVLLAWIALLACYVAARRATAVDPNIALRCD